MKTPSNDFITADTATERQSAEIYHIWNDVVDYYYTSGDVDIVYDGNTYVRAVISRGAVEYSADFSAGTLDVTLAYVENPILQFIANSPVDEYWITVHKILRDMDTPEGYLLFAGQIKTVSFKGTSATARCLSLEDLLNGAVPRYRYQPGCNNSLFDSKCGLTATDYDLSVTVATVSADGLTITGTELGTEDNGRFTRGYATWGSYKRTIATHSGSSITLRYAFPGTVGVGDIIIAFPGCDKTMETCHNKFGNFLNFFGMPYVPLVNPATRI